MWDSASRSGGTVGCRSEEGRRPEAPNGLLGKEPRWKETGETGKREGGISSAKRLNMRLFCLILARSETILRSRVGRGKASEEGVREGGGQDN